MPNEPAAQPANSPDVLVGMGLIDISSIDRWDHPDGEEHAPEPQAPQQAGGQKADAPAGGDWESDDNPYKAALEEARAQANGNEPTLEQQVAAIQTRAAEVVPQVVTQLLAQGMVPADANGQPDMQKAQAMAVAMVSSEVKAHVATLQQQHDRKVIFRTGAVQAAAAEKIAKQLSVGGVKIDPKDLKDAPTMEVMLDRAQRMAADQRSGKFEARKAKGSNRVEGGAAPGAVSAEVIDKLSPQEKIAYGIRHGRY